MIKNRLQILLTSLLALSSFLLSAQSISLHDIWTKGSFYPQRMYSLTALQHSPQYTVLSYNQQDNCHEINLYDFASLSKVKTLFSGAKQQLPRIDSYRFDKDEKFLLIASHSEYIYRHSFVADYYLYDLNTGSLQKITNTKIQEPVLSPDAKTIAFARDNNLYLYDLATQKETPLTTDGRKNLVINGIADWVYEEEFGAVRFFEWNADGSQIAYVRFDEQKVPEFSMDIYGESLYPTQQTFKYPKAGEANSSVSLHIYDLSKKTNYKIPLNAYYIPRLQWSNAPHLLTVQTLNRHQNNWQVLQVNTQTKASSPLLKENSNTYISINNQFFFLPDNSFIYQSEKDGHNHLYLCKTNGKVNAITHGKWEVTQFYGYDPKKQEVFYQSTEIGSTQRGVYAIGLNGKKHRPLSTEAGTNKATFSGDFSMYIHAFANASTPPRYTLNDSKTGKPLKEILTNTQYAERLKEFNLPSKEFLEIKTSKGAFNAYMLKPVDFNPNKQYPLLMYQYSGPGSQEVANQWWDMNDFWHAMLTQKGYIVLCVDGRGTGYKGAEFKKCTYQQLGKYEVEDQTEVAKIVGAYPYIDKNRIGIWGWSFGGFMSTNCLFQSNEVFKMAIAVAPVTNWRFYDSIYTERFMRTPQENAMGYDENSPLFHAAKLKGKYLLIHGSADDNVHVQNAMVLINTLISFQKDFQWLIYPDKNHGIYDNTGSTRWQLYTKMTQFIEENL